MIFKLRVKKDDVFGAYDPTNTFHVDAFLSMEDSRKIVAAAKEFVSKNDMSKLVINDREVHFNITNVGGEFILIPTAKRKYDFDDFMLFIHKETGFTVDQLKEHTRLRDYVRVRSIVFSAMIYFGKCSYKGISRMFGFKHETVMHARRKTLPALLLSKDEVATDLVGKIASMYGDYGFVEFCGEFDYKTVNYEKPAITPIRKYRGVYKVENKSGIKWRSVVYNNRKSITVGTFPTRGQALDERYAYCKNNGIELKNNRVV